MTTSAALFGQTKTALLSLFYGRTDEAFHVRELVRSLDSGSGAVQREVKNLWDCGLLTKTQKGNRCFYQVNKASPLYSRMRDLITTASLEDVETVMKAALNPLRSKIETAFVFGSVAKGTAKPDSDIDVMVVGDLTFQDLVPRLAKAEKALHRKIDPVLYTSSEYRSKLDNNNHFLTAVMRGEKNLLVADDK